MTQRQIQLIKNTWSLFQAMNPVLVGDVFYTKLFIAVPKVKPLFRITTEEQSEKLIEMLNVIVGRLDRLHELDDEIKGLAVRHIRYGVKREHYQHVGNALLWTLENGLGRDWNEEVKEAWRTCYQTLSTTMINAAGYK